MNRHGTATLRADDPAIQALRAFVTANNANKGGFFVETNRLQNVIEGVYGTTPELRAGILASLKTQTIGGKPFVDTLHLARAFGHMYSTFGHQPGFDAIKEATEDPERLPTISLPPDA